VYEVHSIGRLVGGRKVRTIMSVRLLVYGSLRRRGHGNLASTLIVAIALVWEHLRLRIRLWREGGRKVDMIWVSIDLVMLL